jgi:hypothetical protein
MMRAPVPPGGRRGDQNLLVRQPPLKKSNPPVRSLKTRAREQTTEPFCPADASHPAGKCSRLDGVEWSAGRRNDDRSGMEPRPTGYPARGCEVAAGQNDGLGENAPGGSAQQFRSWGLGDRKRAVAREGLTAFVSRCRATTVVGAGTACLPPGAARFPGMEEGEVGERVSTNIGGSSRQAARTVAGLAPTGETPAAESNHDALAIEPIRSSPDRNALVLNRVQAIEAGAVQQPGGNGENRGDRSATQRRPEGVAIRKAVRVRKRSAATGEPRPRRPQVLSLGLCHMEISR